MTFLRKVQEMEKVSVEFSIQVKIWNYSKPSMTHPKEITISRPSTL